jgi:uncharacterized protein (DUF697 family)
MASVIPVDLRQLSTLITGVQEEYDRVLRLQVIVDESISPEFRELARAAFRSTVDSLSVFLLSYSDDLDTVLPALDRQADLSVILANRSALTAEVYMALRQQKPVVTVAEDISTFVNVWPGDLQIDINRLIAISTELHQREGLAMLFANLAQWIIRNDPENIYAWASGFSFIRQTLVKEIINDAALQNGVISSAFFLPGADLPVLLLNQIRMIFRLAAIHDVRFDQKPWPEMVVLIAQAFGWRYLARYLIEQLPAVSWAIRISVGYGGTAILGHAALVYFDFVLQNRASGSVSFPKLKIEPQNNTEGLSSGVELKADK